MGESTSSTQPQVCPLVKRYTVFSLQTIWHIIQPSWFEAHSTLQLSFFFFVCLGVSLFLQTASVWTQEYETLLPPIHLQHRFAPHPEPSTVCLSAHSYSSRACRSPSSFFLPHQPPPPIPHSVLSFVFAPLTPPPSQVSFHGLASQPPQPETSQSLASFLPTLPLWPSMSEHVCVGKFVYVLVSLLLCVHMEYVHAQFMVPASELVWFRFNSESVEKNFHL